MQQEYCGEQRKHGMSENTAGRLCVGSGGWTQTLVREVAHFNHHTFLSVNTHQTASHFFPRQVHTTCGFTEVIF